MRRSETDIFSILWATGSPLEVTRNALNSFTTDMQE